MWDQWLWGGMCALTPKEWLSVLGGQVGWQLWGPPRAPPSPGCSILGGAWWGQRGTRRLNPWGPSGEKGKGETLGGCWGSPGVGRGHGIGGPSPPGTS